VSQVRNRIMAIVCAAANKLALPENTCILILDQQGFLPASGWVMVHLCDIPNGLNANETESFLRREGAKICGPRRS